METEAGDRTCVRRSVTVRRPLEEVYGFWRGLENLPLFMKHLQSVVTTGNRSHWVVKGPAGTSYAWDAEITRDVPNQEIRWRTLAGSEVESEGVVRFCDAPGDRGTEIRVELAYAPPGSGAGASIAKLFGEEPDQQIRDDLRRFKQVMETGEVVRSEGSLEGAGQGASEQRAAQAPEARP